MKVYHKSDKPRARLNKKAIVSIGVSLALLGAALAITLTLALKGKSPLLPDPDPTPANTTPVYVLPVDAFEIGMVFSDQELVMHVTSGIIETHEALDFLVESGTKVKAIFDGTVLSIDQNTTMEGTAIKIQHTDGIVSVYKGLGDTDLEVGMTVKSGDVIGVVGYMSTEAREYEQPHLHLEVFKNDKSVDPLNYLPEIGDK